MSFEALLNHTVRVYREPDPLANRDVMGNVPTVPEPVGTAWSGYNARPDQFWRGNMKDPGPGEITSRLRRWFLHKDLDVEERDILLVTAGPNVGQRWRVVGLTRLSRRTAAVHHIEAECERWEGELG